MNEIETKVLEVVDQDIAQSFKDFVKSKMIENQTTLDTGWFNLDLPLKIHITRYITTFLKMIKDGNI